MELMEFGIVLPVLKFLFSELDQGGIRSLASSAFLSLLIVSILSFLQIKRSKKRNPLKKRPKEKDDE